MSWKVQTMASNKMVLLRFLGAGIVAYLVLLVFFWIFPPFGNPLYEPKRPLQPSDLPAIEEAIGLDLPNIQAVKNIVLWHGKDTTLYAKLEVSGEQGGKLLEVVKNRAEPYDRWPISSPEPMAAWFRPPLGGMLPEHLMPRMACASCSVCRGMGAW